MFYAKNYWSIRKGPMIPTIEKYYRLIFPLFVLISACVPRVKLQDVSSDIPEIIDFNFDVKPILSDKCFQCHGPDLEARKADLRLDIKEDAFAVRGEHKHRAIVPGNPANSQVFIRVYSENPEEIMPPPESKMSLTPTEKAIIARWIEQGADYKPHWSFISPQKTGITNNDITVNPVDHFVQKKLLSNQLEKSARADKETLIRRLYFTITGLPPSLEDIDAFFKDHSPDSYELLVDKLLKSTAYGERMASVWMDLARYADSDGYLDDKHRDVSAWRDWVIDAFNENMPYSDFVTAQLAGDLLPGAKLENKLATAFNRLHKKNSEAGIVFEEYRNEYVADRTNTLGTAFLGLSLECARCHDHKYDPVSQEDYYKLAAFFNSTFETGSPVYGPDQTPSPALMLTTDEDRKYMDSLQLLLQNLTKEEALNRQQALVTFKEWQKKNEITETTVMRNLEKKMVAHYPFDKVVKDSKGNFSSPESNGVASPAILSDDLLEDGVNGKAFVVDDYIAVRLGEKVGWYEKSEPFSLALWLYPEKMYDDVGILFHCEDLRLGLKGYSFYLNKNKVRFVMAHSWPQNAIEIITRDSLPKQKWSQLVLTYDGSGKAEGVTIYINGKEAAREVVSDNLYKGILYVPDIHTYGFLGIRLGYRDKFDLFKKGRIDEIKVFNDKLERLEVACLYGKGNMQALLADKSTEEEVMFEYYLSNYNKEEQVVRKEQEKYRTLLTEKANSIKEIMVMGDTPEPRPTYVLNRGLYNARGKEVKPGTPDRILPFDPDTPPNRLGLSEWLFDKANPLTARVFVNRIWQMHFGQGIVQTAEDFGNQGGLPSHPELLDWLAVDFMESGWDIKRLHKTILMSETYQQSSKITTERWLKDPENRLLSRGPRFRLPAEMIRDNALSVSGLLVSKKGGESVYPYQPEGLWDELSNKSWRYPYLQEPGEGLYRRSLYTIWKRTSPPPAMLIFDMADRSVCTVRRKTTSTPQQALVLLNGPQYIEAARALAESLMLEEENQGKRLENAFRRLTGRLPHEEEAAYMKDFYEQEVNHFNENRKKALEYLSIGERNWNKNLDPSQLSAMSVVINSMMNTYECYTLQ